MNEERNEVLPEWGYRIFRPLLSPIFKLYYRPKLIGKEKIPSEGPIIFAGNHKHILDQCLVIISTKRIVHYMAKKEYFDGPFAWFFKITGTIPVNRSTKDAHAKKLAREVLKREKALGIFPEGTRNKTDELLLPFHLGTVKFAQESGATIVPFAIKGEYKFAKNQLRIIYGEPFKVKEEEDLIEANAKLFSRVEELLKDDSQ